MKKIFYLVLLHFPLLLSAQALYDKNWVLGYSPATAQYPDYGGFIATFHQDSLQLDKMGFKSKTPFACISDKYGKLIAYTEGCRVWNREHAVMSNGDTLNPGKIFNNYCHSTYPVWQGCLFLPFPGNDSKFILFHIRGDDIGEAFDNLLYSVIDLRGNDHNGKVIEKNKLIITDPYIGQYITATKHANGRDWWIVVPQRFKTGYHRVLLSPKGVEVQPMVSLGKTTDSWWGGQTAFSADGRKYIRNLRDGLQIIDFDRCSGAFSNFQFIPYDSTFSGYGGVCTSGSGQYLYLTAFRHVYQLDLWSSDIPASTQLVATYKGLQAPLPAVYFQAQLAPNGKIYAVSTNSNKVLHVIHEPEVRGVGCKVEEGGLPLPSFTGYTMLNFVHYRLGALSGSPCDTLTVAAEEPKRVVVADGMDVYPNPTSDYLNFNKLSFLQGLSGRLRLYNMSGGLIWDSEFPKSEHTLRLPVRAWPAGVYGWDYLNEQGLRVSGRVVVVR